jgi:putative oxidoreductase
MKEQTVSRFAIILLAVVMAVFGVYHFIYPQNLVSYVPAFLPAAGNLWVYIPGAAFILAAIAFITNRKVKIAAYMLAILLFIFVLTIHLPNYLNGSSDENRQMSFINLLKDTAIAAFALHIASNSPD